MTYAVLTAAAYAGVVSYLDKVDPVATSTNFERACSIRDSFEKNQVHEGMYIVELDAHKES